MGCEQQLKVTLYKIENDKTVHWRKNETETKEEEKKKLKEEEAEKDEQKECEEAADLVLIVN